MYVLPPPKGNNMYAISLVENDSSFHYSAKNIPMHEFVNIQEVVPRDNPPFYKILAKGWFNSESAKATKSP